MDFLELDTGNHFRYPHCCGMDIQFQWSQLGHLYWVLGDFLELDSCNHSHYHVVKLQI